MRSLVCLSIAVLAVAGKVDARDYNLTISQYKHKSWRFEDGAPAPVFSITQDQKGFLWIGARDGLFRFDGLRFEHIPAVQDDKNFSMATAVLATHNGDVWVYFGRPGRFAVYRDGALRLAPSLETGGFIANIAEGPNGELWANSISPPYGRLYRYNVNGWQRVDNVYGLRAEQPGNPLTSRDGAIWVAGTLGVDRMPLGARQFQHVLSAPFHRYAELEQDPSGRVWLISDQGLQVVSGLNGRPLPKLPPPIRLSTGLQPHRFKVDEGGNFWVGGIATQIQKFSLSPQCLSTKCREPQKSRFGAAQGLSSDSVQDILVDREKNIWVGTTLGLDRFRKADLMVEPSLTRAAPEGDALALRKNGGVIVAQLGGLFEIPPYGEPKKIFSGYQDAQIVCEAPDASLWIADNGRFITIKGVKASYAKIPDEYPEACASDGQGRLWMTGPGEALYRYESGRWLTINPLRPSRDTAITDERHPIFSDGRGGVIILDHEAVRLVHGNSTKSIVTAAKVPLNTVYTLLPTPIGILLAGEGGLIRLRGNHVDQIPASRIPALTNTSGLATAGDYTWALATAGAVRFKTADLQEAFTNPTFAPPAKVFSFAEGLPNGQAGFAGLNLIRGGDGRLWFNTWSGPVWLDPSRIQPEGAPLRAAVTSVAVGQTRIFDPSSVRLQPGDGDIEFDFSALTLATPESARVSYQLEGIDRTWVDPGSRRQAFYTNLPPDHYRFRVRAARKDGTWGPETTLAVVLPPTFLQSWVFTALVFAIALAILWSLYRLRLRALAGRMQARVNERLAERERIARDLHDTLLQGFQGLVYRLQGLANDPDQPARVKGRMEEALDRASGAIAEGRDRVWLLRTDVAVSSLAERLALIGERLERDFPGRFTLSVSGTREELDPAVAEDLARIGGEALFNAFRHAQASRIVANLDFGRTQLSLVVRDDGVGLDPEIEQVQRRSGHFGLQGMQERAERWGGRFSISKGKPTGTIVSVIIPMSKARAQKLSTWPRLRSIVHRVRNTFSRGLDTNLR